jgi:hypothetical protein
MAMARALALAQRYARARGSLPALQQRGGALVPEGEDGLGFVPRVNSSAMEDQKARASGQRRSWNGRWLAAGAFSLSFAASTMSVAFGKERVADRFAPKDVVLYQYDACPFCNKVKGRSSNSRLFVWRV